MLTQFLENYPIDLTMNPTLDFWKSACVLIISGDNCYETCCNSQIYHCALKHLPTSDGSGFAIHQVLSIPGCGLHQDEGAKSGSRLGRARVCAAFEVNPVLRPIP